MYGILRNEYTAVNAAPRGRIFFGVIHVGCTGIRASVSRVRTLQEGSTLRQFPGLGCLGELGFECQRCFFTSAPMRVLLAARMKRILFVCTGNWYRSRLAEALFNHLAQRYNLNWKAESRGILCLRRLPGRRVIAPWAARQLKRWRIPVPKNPTRFLDPDWDWNSANIIVVMDESEHRELLQSEGHPTDHSRLVYWHVPDSDVLAASAGIEKIRFRVCRLVRRLKRIRTDK